MRYILCVKGERSQSDERSDHLLLLQYCFKTVVEEPEMTLRRANYWYEEIRVTFQK